MKKNELHNKEHPIYKHRQYTPFIEIKKLVDRCRKCNKELPKYNRHHFLCKQCWEEEQWNKGNIALIGGVK